MADVIWTKRAYEHIDDLANFISKNSSFQARRVVKLIMDETTKLKRQIRIGKIIPEIRHDIYRELKVFKYRIMYKIISEEKVLVLGVIHGSRLFDISLID